MFLTSIAAWVLAALAIAAYEQTTFQERAAQELSQRAILLSLNLTAALQFGDKEAATEILATVRDLPLDRLLTEKRVKVHVFALQRHEPDMMAAQGGMDIAHGQDYTGHDLRQDVAETRNGMGQTAHPRNSTDPRTRHWPGSSISRRSLSSALRALAK